MKKCGIYKITNLVNQKIYIGKSVNIYERFEQHKLDSTRSEELWQANKRHEQTPLHKAMRKYGINNFTLEIIEECEKEQLNKREIYWINYYNSTNCNIGYNLTEGGDGYDFGVGENAITAKLTQQEVDIIKNALKSGLQDKDIITLLKNKISLSTISAINVGQNWHDDNEIYPLRVKGKSKMRFTDKEVMDMRNRWSKGEHIADLAREYKACANTINSLVHGNSYKHLPVIPQIIKPVYQANQPRLFSNEEVIKYRNLYYINKQSILSIYNNYQINTNYVAFYNMIKGKTYKDIEGLPNDRL